MPTISASSPRSRTAESSVTTSSSAAAWADQRQRETFTFPGSRSASSSPMKSSRRPRRWSGSSATTAIAPTANAPPQVRHPRLGRRSSATSSPRLLPQAAAITARFADQRCRSAPRLAPAGGRQVVRGPEHRERPDQGRRLVASALGLRAIVERFSRSFASPHSKTCFLATSSRRIDRPSMRCWLSTEFPVRKRWLLALEHGVPGHPHLWLSAHRIRTHAAGDDRRVASDLGIAGPVRRKTERTHDRLSERSARPYQSDVGLVGRSGDKYTLFVGGTNRGDRLNFVLQDLVPRDRLVPTLKVLLERFRSDRRADEGFGDWCTRVGLGGAVRHAGRVAAEDGVIIQFWLPLPASGRGLGGGVWCGEARTPLPQPLSPKRGEGRKSNYCNSLTSIARK